MPLVSKKLDRFAEQESPPVKIIRSVAAMYSAVTVWAQQDEICEPIGFCFRISGMIPKHTRNRRA